MITVKDVLQKLSELKVNRNVEEGMIHNVIKECQNIEVTNYGDLDKNIDAVRHHFIRQLDWWVYSAIRYYYFKVKMDKFFNRFNLDELNKSIPNNKDIEDFCNGDEELVKLRYKVYEEYAELFVRAFLIWNWEDQRSCFTRFMSMVLSDFGPDSEMEDVRKVHAIIMGHYPPCDYDEHKKFYLTVHPIIRNLVAYIFTDLDRLISNMCIKHDERSGMLACLNEKLYSLRRINFNLKRTKQENM